MVRRTQLGIEGRNETVRKRNEHDPLDNMQRPWVHAKPVPMDPSTDPGPALLAGLRTEFLMDDEWCDLDGRALRWTGGAAPLVFSVSEPFEMNGDITVKVCARATLVTDVQAAPDVALRVVNLANTHASVGSLVWLADRREVAVFVAQYAHAGNDSVTSLLSPFALLAYTEGLAKLSEGLASILAGAAAADRDDEDDLLRASEQVVIPGGAEAQRWDGEELEAMGRQWEQGGLMSMADETGLTVEFPYSSSVPMLMRMMTDLGATGGGGSTSLYNQQLDNPHPSYGNGLFTLLRIPDAFDEDEALEHANALNMAELLETTGFPNWGSWCTMEGALCHVAFIPNVIARPGLISTINFYALSRSQWVQERLLPLDLVREVRAGDR